MSDLTIEYRHPSELTGYDKNSRTHSEEQINQIVASIKEFGFTNPILVQDGKIIAGHGRLAAAKKAELDRIPTIELKGLSETQVRALVIADNQLALNAGWDLTLLKEEIEELKLEDYDIDLLGFDDSFLDGLLEPAPGVGLVDDDSTPDLAEDPISVPGDVWILGEHRLMCGDSTSIDAVERLMDGQLADQLITDPPYNVAYEGKTKESLTIENDEMGDADFRQFLRDCFINADSVMKTGAVFYIWHADSEGYNFRGACSDANWKVRQCLIWKKQTMVMGRQDYHWQHEPCLYGWKDGAAHLWAADRKQTTILEFDRPSRNAEHPTMKPVALIEYQMLNNTKGQDVVLDLFGGSGTTLIAAEKHNRVARLMELDPKYCDVIVKRWQEFSGKEAIHEDGSTFKELSTMRPSQAGEATLLHGGVEGSNPSGAQPNTED